VWLCWTVWWRMRVFQRKVGQLFSHEWGASYSEHHRILRQFFVSLVRRRHAPRQAAHDAHTVRLLQTKVIAWDECSALVGLETGNWMRQMKNWAASLIAFVAVIFVGWYSGAEYLIRGPDQAFWVAEALAHPSGCTFIAS